MNKKLTSTLFIVLLFLCFFSSLAFGIMNIVVFEELKEKNLIGTSVSEGNTVFVDDYRGRTELKYNITSDTYTIHCKVGDEIVKSYYNVQGNAVSFRPHNQLNSEYSSSSDWNTNGNLVSIRWYYCALYFDTDSTEIVKNASDIQDDWDLIRVVVYIKF